MALIKCPECQNAVSEKAKLCPHCGCPITRKKVRLSKKEIKYVQLKKERESMFGNLSKVIRIYSENSPQNIYVYEATKTIFIASKQFAFSDILSCRIDSRAYTAKITHNTKNDSGELETSTREKTYYYVFIGVNDILTPLITIQLGQRVILGKEICTLINAIISTNKSQKSAQ